MDTSPIINIADEDDDLQIIEEITMTDCSKIPTITSVRSEANSTEQSYTVTVSEDEDDDDEDFPRIQIISNFSSIFETTESDDDEIDCGFMEHKKKKTTVINGKVGKLLSLKKKIGEELKTIKTKLTQLKSPARITSSIPNSPSIKILRPVQVSSPLVNNNKILQPQIVQATQAANAPISILRQWPIQTSSSNFLITTLSEAVPKNTMTYVRAGPNNSPQGQPMLFDAASGLLLYSNINLSPQQMQQTGVTNAQNVYRRPLNSTIVGNTSPYSVQQQQQQNVLRIGGQAQTVTVNNFPTPRIVGVQSNSPSSFRTTSSLPTSVPSAMIQTSASQMPRMVLQRQVQQQSTSNAYSPRQQVRPQQQYQMSPQWNRSPVPNVQPVRPQMVAQQPRLIRPPPPLQQQQVRKPLPMSPVQQLRMAQVRMATPSPPKQSISVASTPSPAPKISVPLQAKATPPQKILPRGAGGATTPLINGLTESPGVETTSAENDTNNNKTFPSLVVTVKPCLMDKVTRSSLGSSRTELDAKVKSLLVFTAQKFTEWLMQRGLLRIEHKCPIHVGDDNLPFPFSLGMYSDNRQPFSGGYVWIGDCCGRDKEVSVFQGSIFEASIYTPGTLLKLIYHWSCQTTANSVLQWVKVTSYYLKNFYTLLRSACVAALHEMCPVMGGSDKYVEIGIITLGTTLSGQSGPKNVKVEILGVFDPSAKIIRMKVINPQQEGVQGSHSRIMQILWPLNHWVAKTSIILIDNSIDKTLLEEMGFKRVQQSKGPMPSTTAKKPPNPTNINVMNYLKHVIPKMFQSTLCVLSKSLIQQFLDELSWREIWGGNPSKTFENMLNHLVEMTKWDTGESLISRLNKISLDPFGEWSYSRNLPQGIDMLPSSITGGSDMPLLSIQSPIAQNLQNGSAKSSPISGRRSSALLPKPPVLTPQAQPIAERSAGGLKRKFTQDLTPFLALEPKNFVLQTYYYASCDPKINTISTAFPTTLKCPLCMKTFMNNLDIIPHIQRHVMHGGSRPNPQNACDYCLKEFSTKAACTSHTNEIHFMSGTRYSCQICEEKFVSEGTWIIHMWENHEEAETPYLCETCQYRSSFHTDIVDHFHKKHTGIDYVQCPLCLKTMSARSVQCIKHIVVHLQTHAVRRNKKCPQCVLLFPSDQEYRQHIISDKSHRSLQGQGFDRYVLTSTDVPSYMPKPPKVPKDKFVLPPPTKKAKTSNPPPKSSSSLNTFAIPIDTSGNFTMDPFGVEVLCEDNIKCLECKTDMDNENHYIGYMTCNKCTYATCCTVGMTTHHTRCHSDSKTNTLMSGLRLGPVKTLDTPLTCQCGFSATNPYKLVNHLVECDKSTAYPQKESVVEEISKGDDDSDYCEEVSSGALDTVAESC